MPAATVAAIISTEKAGIERILLTRRNIDPYKGLWCLPGGHINQYETAKHAIEREVLEETGLTFDATFFGCFDEIIPDCGIHAVVLVYVGKFEKNIAFCKEEVIEVGWFSLSECLSFELAFTHKEVIQFYADGRKLTDLT